MSKMIKVNYASMIKIIFISIFIFLNGSCNGQVKVKFKNESQEDFKLLTANILGKEFIFKDVKKGESTPYVEVDKTYPYCPLKIETAKDTVGFLPIDYVGEKLYTSGKLTMVISIATNANGDRYVNIQAKRPVL